MNARIFRLTDHLNRLYDSADRIFMKPPMPREELAQLLDEIVRKNLAASQGKDLLVEIIFSGGLAGVTMKHSGRGAHLYVAVQALITPDADLYRNGVRLASFPHQRMCPDIKLLNYVGAIIANQTTVPQYNAYDVVFLDPVDGKTILEGSTFSVFFVDSHGEVVTPPLDGRILDSVTRRVTLETLEAAGTIKVQEAEVTMDDLSEMSESFMASTTRSILPVSAINDISIGSGSPGPTTAEIMEVFQAYLQSY